MGIIESLIDFILHIDKNLNLIIQNYGIFTYLILFFIIFCETGLVVAPFFPGDSLIFVAGAFAGSGSLNIEWLIILFSLAAIIGDTVNYWIGNFVGPKVFHKKDARFFKKEYLDDANKFYEKHGGKTIILARFIPIVRTFAPFVAGIGKMSYRRFIIYNILGGVAWVSIFSLGGYYFGSLPIVKENLSLVIFAIIFISLIPVVIKFLKSKIRKPKSR
jgi:membrane-associated protein